MKYLSVVILLCSMASAQDATVLELEKDEAKQAAQLYEAKMKADAAWDEMYARVQHKYLEKGFLGGLKFSKDFRFIVPTEGITVTNGVMPLGGCLLTVPTGTGTSAFIPLTFPAYPTSATTLVMPQ